MRIFTGSYAGSFLATLLFCGILSLCEGGSKTSDTNILLQFKESRQSTSFLSSWNLSVNPNICDGWRGVTCESGRVSTLKLQDLAMGGSIPPELVGLDKLIGLRLSNLSLVGTIPPELGNLHSITEGINLESNSLNGSIPKELGKLSNSQALKLGYNQLTGEIPDSLSNCTGLRTLQLFANNLTGTLPKWIGNLSNLIELRLQENYFYGPIPQEIGNLEFLEQLLLNDNDLNGTIPQELNNLMNLKALDLHNNFLTGSLPSDPMFFVLETLDVSQNNLTGSIPEGYAALPSLIGFSANDNMLNGSLPTSWEAPALETLNLNGNQLSGPIPSSIISSRLLILSLYGNQFTGSIPKSVKNGVSLNELNLQNNRLSGAIPTEFSMLLNLTTLLLYNNNFSGSIPASLGKCGALVELDLSNNSLEGPIPLELASLSNVQTLNVANNKLNGSLPSELNKMPILLVLDVSGNSLTEPIPPSLFNSSSAFRDVLLNNNQFNGSIPSTLGLLTQVLHIRLDSNQLSGNIPSSLSNLTKLETLLLQNNQLEGTIPAEFSNLDALSSFNVSNNRLDGAIPSGTLQNFNISSYANNSGLCGTASLPLCQSNTQSKGSKLSTGGIVGIVLAAVFLASIILILIFLLVRKKESKDKAFAYEDPGDGDFILFQKIGYPLTYTDILKSTNHFDEEKKLGAGGFGTVYSALLPDGETTVAIKRLSQSSRQGIKELQAEVNTLGQIHHRNLVTLIGSYMSDKSGEALLIYSFVSGGSLDGLLHKKSPVFKPWSVRLNVLIGSARGLKYLHHDSTPCIIHRDIKPANILLDENMEAHVADFGLAKVIDVSRTHLSTAVSGTVGYMSPEYAQKGKLTTKSDVFSFGVVILQVVTGKRPTDAILANKGLSKWISDYWLKNAATEVFDPEMEVSEAEEGQVLGALKLGLLCTSKSPSERPSMAEVVNILENLDTYSSGMTNP